MAQTSDHFVSIMKDQTYRELTDQLAAELTPPWSWERLFALLEDLGIKDPYGYLAAAWWVPPEDRAHRGRLDEYAATAQAAIKDGTLPDPAQAGPGAYRWDHVRRLGERCGLEPRILVKTIIWQYGATLAEDLMLEKVRRHAPPPVAPRVSDSVSDSRAGAAAVAGPVRPMEGGAAPGPGAPVFPWLLARDSLCPFCNNYREVIALAADAGGNQWTAICRGCFAEILVEVGHQERATGSG